MVLILLATTLKQADTISRVQGTVSIKEKLDSEQKVLAKLKEDSSGPIGYIKRPTFIQGSDASSFNTDDGKLHIIFSSGCNYFQHWQSELLLSSALLAGQHGRITRIVSGCYDKTAETAKHRHQTFPGGKNDHLVPVDILNKSVNENFGLFITPQFEGAVDFPWINKPSSINFFMKYARKELDKFGETVIAIIDPDFIFLKPLTQAGESEDNIIATRGQIKDDIVIKGRPVGQRYGLEGGWVNKFKPVDQITGDPNSASLHWTSKEAAQWTSVGPPMIVEIDDLTNLADKWEFNMRPVLKVGGPDILADMYAYSIAAADLDLKHTTLDHYMISTWGHTGQAYSFVEEFEQMSCSNPSKDYSPSTAHWPVFIHLASNFKAFDETEDEWMFHKGHVPGNILDCDMPLIVAPPENLFDLNREDESIKVHQKAWVVCNTISRLNSILLKYKEKFCPAGYETRELVRLIQHKTVDRGCSQTKDKWCFPLAQIEGLPENWRESKGL